ncbi:MAG TPA: thioredoxin-disulfide reductase [Conexivisphaerales archaeon]|nr:thioredoxin-disulfide reductase [Conexivisphaerales archaeon]
MSEKLHVPILVIGSGPAGLTAAVYAARAGYLPYVIGGYEFGGQLMLTTAVENYTGFPDGVLGPDLMANMRKQAENNGAKMVDRNVTRVDFSTKPFRVWVEDTEYTADAVIVATGASAKWLGFESENRFKGRGVSSCAVCDGAFFKGQDLVVVGGGDVAMEDSLYLSKLARSVTVIHRRDKLRASHVMQRRAMAAPNIRFVWDSVVEEVLGDRKVEGVKVRNLKTGEASTIRCGGLFVSIGHSPNTSIFKDQIELDKAGYAVAKERTMSSREGVFLAGDVADHIYRQAITAAGSGCQAALDAVRYLEAEKDRQ